MKTRQDKRRPILQYKEQKMRKAADDHASNVPMHYRKLNWIRADSGHRSVYFGAKTPSEARDFALVPILRSQQF